MPHQPVEDGGRTVRAPAGRAGRPPPPLNRLPPPHKNIPATHPQRGHHRGHPPGAKLFVVTGPSGAGKGTLIRALIERRPDLEVAVSATTRPRRPGEVDGRDYYFLSEEEFLRRVANDEFLEHVVYVSGQRYGTLRSEVERILARGRSCILELETKGARAVRDARPESVTIFVTTPSFVELERRLRERATESAGEIEERLELARRQMDEADEFEHTVVNDDLERAVAALEALVEREVAAHPATSSGL